MFFLNRFFISCILFFSIILQAQNKYELSGFVSGNSDGEPLIGAEVFLLENNRGTTTDKDGKFVFSVDKPGKYTLRFSYLGYATIIKNFSVPSDEAANILVELEESIVNLNEVIVTGNPFRLEPKDISQTTISLDYLDLIINSNRSVADALNFQPGVSIRSNGIATGRPVIRGFSNYKVIILEDGLRTGDLSGSSDDHGVSVDGSQPDRIEVLQGPASLLYGSGAIGGVVNIITDAIPSSVYQGFNGEMLVQGSTVNNEYLGNAHINYGSGIFALHGKFFRRKGLNYKIPVNLKTPGSDLDKSGGQAGFSIHPDWGVMGLSYMGIVNKYGLPFSSDDDEAAFIEMNKQQFRFAGDYNKINFFLNSLSIKAGYIDYSHKEISRIDGSIGTQFGMKTFSADMSLSHKPLFNNSEGVIGFYALIQDYKVVGEEALTPDAGYQSYAGYFLEKINFSDNLSLNVGTRFEFNRVELPAALLQDSLFSAQDRNSGTVSVSAGAVFNISGSTSLWLNIANAFRSPVVEELSSYGIHRALASFDVGSRSLKNENTLGADLGIRSANNKYYFELTGFYNKISGLIYRKPLAEFYDENSGFNFDGAGYRVSFFDQADAEVYGFQFKFSYEFIKGFTATIVSDYVRGRNLDRDENLAQIPPLRSSVEIRKVTSKYWYGLRWNGTAPQNNTAPDESPTPGYGVLGLFAGLKIVTGEYAHIIDFIAENILDQPYKDHLSAIKDFTYMPGRNFCLGYRFVF